MPAFDELYRPEGSQKKCLVKNVQQIEITITAGSATGQAAIPSPVQKDKTSIHYLGLRTTDALIAHNSSIPRVELTDGNTVTAYLNTANSTDNITVMVQLVEWSDIAVNKVYHGATLIPTGDDAWFEQVEDEYNVDAAGHEEGVTAIIHLGSTSSSSAQGLRENTNTFGSSSEFDFNPYELTADIGVLPFRDQNEANTLLCGWCIISFRKGVVKQFATVTGAKFTGSTLAVSHGETFDLDNTMMFWGGFAAAGGFQDQMPRMVLGATDVTLTVGASMANRVYSVCSVIEFWPKWIEQRVENEVTIGTGVAVVDDTVSAFDRTKTLLSMLGFSTDNAASNMNLSYPTIEFTSDTNIRVQRQTSSGVYSTTVSYIAMEFAVVA